VSVDHDISDLNYQIEKPDGVAEAATTAAPAGRGSAGPGT
jgi:hypothetical protein